GSPSCARTALCASNIGCATDCNAWRGPVYGEACGEMGGPYCPYPHGCCACASVQANRTSKATASRITCTQRPVCGLFAQRSDYKWFNATQGHLLPQPSIASCQIAFYRKE